MTWKLTLELNHLNTKECRLTMTHCKRNVVLRQWFGPMAHQLLQMAKGNLNPVLSTTLDGSLLIDKQMAQYFLIEASFYHQKCLQQFQITADLKNKHLPIKQDLCELLLYIRMTHQHPSHESLAVFSACHLPCNAEFNQAIESLVDTRLIQRIEFLHFTFYDKNPYPHDHIFDCNSQTLKDHDCFARVNSRQKRITQHINH